MVGCLNDFVLGRQTGGEEAGGREAIQEAATATVIQAGKQDSLGGDSPS